MTYKVAFVSSDGKVVNQHFGKAQNFLIVEINDTDYKFLEKRENTPTCQGFEHSEEAMDKSIALIQDCEAVFVSKVGNGARNKLEAKGVTPFEAPYFIEDIIKKLINSKVKII
jgi:predicted Fe-Mo cluster-binding NifX family protein